MRILYKTPSIQNKCFAPSLNGCKSLPSLQAKTESGPMKQAHGFASKQQQLFKNRIIINKLQEILNGVEGFPNHFSNQPG